MNEAFLDDVRLITLESAELAAQRVPYTVVAGALNAEAGELHLQAALRARGQALIEITQFNLGRVGEMYQRAIYAARVARTAFQRAAEHFNPFRVYLLDVIVANPELEEEVECRLNLVRDSNARDEEVRILLEELGATLAPLGNPVEVLSSPGG